MELVLEGLGQGSMASEHKASIGLETLKSHINYPVLAG